MHGWKMMRNHAGGAEEHWLMNNDRQRLLQSSDQSREEGPVLQRFGRGQARRLLVCPFAQIKEFSFTFYENLCGGANYIRPRLILYFCLSGELILEEQEITLDSGRFLAFGATELKRVLFQPELLYRVITVEIYPDKLRDLSSGAYLAAELRRLQAPNCGFSTHTLSPGMKNILYQLLHSPPQDPVRTLYMEGKLLECLSVYLNEAICQQEPALRHCANFSRQDVKSCYEAKRILDQEFISPPTLTGLSKRICLNEFKLKQGFKQLFGQTVHSYVVDKRLELAKQLFEGRTITVAEAAACTGYSNASYFAQVFRKKFGVNPSEYRVR